MKKEKCTTKIGDITVLSYDSWSEAVTHLTSQGVEYIGWANSGIPYPKGKNHRVYHNLRGTSVHYYIETNQLIAVDAGD